MEGFVEVSAVLRSGVYALIDFGEVVYIGKAKDVYVRIYSHRYSYKRKQAGKDVAERFVNKAIRFDKVFVRTCVPSDLDRIEREMIELYKPKYNERLKTTEKIKVEIPVQIGGLTFVLNGRIPSTPKPVVLERRL